MSLKPVQPEEQVQKACQLGLTVLSSPETHIPGNLLDAIQSFKSLLGGVIQGNLFICEREMPPVEKVAAEEPAAVEEETAKAAVPKKVVKKKVASKKA